MKTISRFAGREYKTVTRQSAPTTFAFVVSFLLALATILALVTYVE